MRVSLARDATRATFARADAARATIDRATARRATRSSRGTLSTARGAIDAGTRARVGRGAGAGEKKADVPDVVRETTHALAGGHAVRVETRTRANGTTTATLRAADDALLERCARGEAELTERCNAGQNMLVRAIWYTKLDGKGVAELCWSTLDDVGDDVDNEMTTITTTTTTVTVTRTTK